MTPLTALGVELLAGVGVAVFASITALRPIAILWALACLGTPFFVRTDQPLAVSCLALVASLGAARTVDLLRDPTLQGAMKGLFVGGVE